MKYVKLFSEISKDDVGIAGGKGASLGEMTQAGISVPKGFVILSSIFDRFVSDVGIKAEIDSVLSGVSIEDINSINSASEKIRALILGAEMSEDIVLEIQKSFRDLDCKFVAVRSSATLEDSADAAWAGQLDSFLNTNKKYLLDNIKKCWASLFTPRAIFYRFEKGLHNSNVSVAVVIQKMIQSEVSGIAFSVHPVTEDKNQMIIEAGLGLGEAIVSGSITPDSYVVHKDNLDIVEVNVNEQGRKLVKGGDNNAWVDLGDEGKGRFLDDKKVKELGKLIIKIEEHYGFPVDVEWAYENKEFFIIQSRPITTLGRDTKKDTKDEYKRFGTRDYSLIQLDMENEIGRRKQYSPLYRFLEEILFVHEKNKGTGFYFDCSNDTAIYSSPLIKYFNKHPNQFEKIVKEYEQDRKKVVRLCSEGKDLEQIYKLAIRVSAGLSVFSIMSTPCSDNTNKELMKKANHIRETTDKTVYYIGETFKKLLRKQLPLPLKKYYKFIRFNEIKNINFPSIEELEKRVEGFIFYKNKFYTSISKDKFGEINNIWFNDEKVKKDTKVIRGEVGFGGKVRGFVRIIYEEGQMEKMKNNEILVSPMTTPNLLFAIKKAKAIITDEGGVACHAAIVARELKIPCVVGTKIATEVLRNGDLIEVDGDKGNVKILKK